MLRKFVYLPFFLLLLVTVSVSVRGENHEDDDDDDEADERKQRAHGYGDKVDWVDWEDALEKAEEEDKPVFLLIHKSWCHACKTLKKKFKQSSAQKEFLKMSKHFIMVNTEDDEEPDDEKYSPDGNYIPRLLFITPEGELMTDIANDLKEMKDYRYYYNNPGHIMDAMKKALFKLGRLTPEEAKKKTGGEGGQTYKEKKRDEKLAKEISEKEKKAKKEL